jgi:hypothetical protein
VVSVEVLTVLSSASVLESTAWFMSVSGCVKESLF